MTLTEMIFNRLEEEARRSNLTVQEFVSELDKAARKNNGSAYQYGAILAELCFLSNKETVCRIVRRFKQQNRGPENV